MEKAMGRRFAALIVPADLNIPVRVEVMNAELEKYRKLVQGPVESMNCFGWHVYLNDEADYIPLPPNVRAEVLIREAGIGVDTVKGNAVFLGDGPDGGEADVPEYLLRLAQDLLGLQLAA
ncbi:hypothetical protein [Paenarthrobacter ilicis]|uniref:DUF3846 domain-containing protein n=1 Tax=Paenarthrobacter ilicis TaxID=43665 RepID=A0ABX0TN16_9MICC|nr:hypothetical protein [Paenarthrobacter ilicis]MBM7793152.1 hypothetical protein [Paenarthrobacter ilicis]NIJ02072.1 hypothetical protein [Paenarthrobacter ilicis]